jgi:hypothetical protein
MPTVSGWLSRARRGSIAHSAEEGAAGQHDRHRDIALEAIHGRGVMAAKQRIRRHMVDHHGLAAGANLVADGGLDLQLAAGPQAELDVVPHRTADPSVFGNARHRRKAHPGRAADDVEDDGNRIDPGDRVDVGLEVVTQRHGGTRWNAVTAPGASIMSFVVGARC